MPVNKFTLCCKQKTDIPTLFAIASWAQGLAQTRTRAQVLAHGQVRVHGVVLKRVRDVMCPRA